MKTLKQIGWLALASMLAAGTAAAADELVLRPQCVPSGAIVRLGDVADATTTDEAERHRLLETLRHYALERAVCDIEGGGNELLDVLARERGLAQRP